MSEINEDQPKPAEDQQAEEVDNEAPLFEIIVPSSLTGISAPLHHLKIWGDGRTEGFDVLVGKGKKMQVINRLPMMLETTILHPLVGFVESLHGGIEQLAAGPRGAKFVDKGTVQ